MARLAVLPSIPLLGPRIHTVTYVRTRRSKECVKVTTTKHTDPHRDHPVRQLRRQATVAIEHPVAEQVAGGALTEGGHACVDVRLSSRDSNMLKETQRTVGDHPALPLRSMVIITPPHILQSHGAH